jgi:hypothetical protein
MAVIHDGASYLRRSMGLTCRLSEDSGRVVPKSRSPEQTQTNPLRLTPAASMTWLKNDKNKPIGFNANPFSYLHRFWGRISQFLNESGRSPLESQKTAKQTQTNPLRLTPAASMTWLKNDKNKPIGLNANPFSYLHRFWGQISQFLNESGASPLESQKTAKQTQTNPLR